MNNYVGLDVSLTNCPDCVLQEDGTRGFEGECSTDPDAISETIYLYAVCVERFLHEPVPLSIWLSRECDRPAVTVVYTEPEEGISRQWHGLRIELLSVTRERSMTRHFGMDQRPMMH
ncbi:hypothetical protein [Ruegeria sp. HKCCA6707]|uniref:hypothetical protein n=1 Tax=Ruegeria sp. HKCCA6707 TaxID=2682996 RepID=UPI001488C900|nr:hypothetical protein [Ruegeria sp. HKCCA6707]